MAMDFRGSLTDSEQVKQQQEKYIDELLSQIGKLAKNMLAEVVQDPALMENDEFHKWSDFNLANMVLELAAESHFKPLGSRTYKRWYKSRKEQIAILHHENWEKEDKRLKETPSLL